MDSFLWAEKIATGDSMKSNSRFWLIKGTVRVVLVCAIYFAIDELLGLDLWLKISIIALSVAILEFIFISLDKRFGDGGSES